MTATSDGEQTAAVRALRLTLAIVIGAGTAFVALHDWFGLGGSSLDYAAEGPVYDAVIVAAGLTCLLRSRSAGRERGAWIAFGRGDPLLGRRGDLLDRRDPRRSLAALPLGRRHRVPRLLPVGGPRARAPRPRPRPRTRLARLGGRADRRPRNRRPRRRLRLRLRRRPDRRHRHAGGDDTGLPARGHRPLLDDRRNRRPHPLAPGPGLVAAPGRAGGDGRRRRRLHPAVDRPRASRKGSGPTRST